MPTNTAGYDLAAERRQGVAMGVSPWNTVSNSRPSPSGAARDGVRGLPVAPLGLGAVSPDHHGLTPVATACRPVGTETQQRVSRSGGVSLPSCVFWEGEVPPEPDSMPTNTADYDLSAKRRQGVALGASPWNAVNKSRRSPSGAARDGVRGLPVARLGLGNVAPDNHGLTPVATAYRPVGTETQLRVSRSGGVSLPSRVFGEGEVPSRAGINAHQHRRL